MKHRFSDEQIIGMIKAHKAGVKAQELCRKYGISDATFYKYKAKFGGMNVSEKNCGRSRTRIIVRSGCWQMRCWTTPHLRISRQKITNA